MDSRNRFNGLALVYLFVAFLGIVLSGSAGEARIVSNGPGQLERYAAKELQRYLYQLSGTLLPVQAEGIATSVRAEVTGPAFVIGQPATSPFIKSLIAKGEITISDADPGPQGYLLKRVVVNGQPVIIIAATTEEGCLYGVYGLLEDYYGVGFYMDGDVLPDTKRALTFPDVNQRKRPAVAIRGFLPWTNFPQSATSYSWEDWKFIIDQMAKMRMNFLHIHNYNGECGHNEMFHNVTLDGSTPPVWMATARSGHAWGGRPGCDPNRYLFGAQDLFDDYDFGADCARHNENLFVRDAFRKGASEFQKVIAYAHSRGVKIGLGLDIDVLPAEIRDKGIKADDPRIISNRIGQVIQDYPNLDYLMCFQSEGIHADKERYRAWRNVFDGFYKALKERSPKTRVAVAGWGIRADDVASLPADVICAPISHYSDGCENGSIYGSREYWGCPWLERDFNSSEYYYPYNMHLSNTIKAWQNRAPNMKGFYCLTWRLTDAIDPKMSYMAKAPWDTQGKLNCSETVYRQYAEKNYGKAVAAEITEIINQNEPFAVAFGECQATPAFDNGPEGGFLINIRSFRVHASGQEVPFIAAEKSSKQHGTKTAPCSEGGLCVGFIEDGHWLQFDDVDFGSGSDVFEARTAAPGTGGLIEVHLDSPTGPLIGTCKTDTTGDWQNWANSKAGIQKTSGKRTVVLVFHPKSPSGNDFAKAEAQLNIIDRCIAKAETPAQKARLRQLRCRIEAVKDHIELKNNFAKYQWMDLPGALESWAQNFTHRVSDISSLGNVVSSQNRFVQVNYAGGKVQDLRKTLAVQPPSRVTVRGTPKGALITWQNREANVRAFNVFRNGKKLNAAPIPVATSPGAGSDFNKIEGAFEDKADGVFAYTITAIAQNGAESLPSIPVKCAAGSADKVPPRIVVISPPTSARLGQPIWVTARVLDGRAYKYINARLHYRVFGEKFWHSKAMERRTKAVFCASLESTASGFEYYIEAEDGENKSVFPASGPEMPLSTVVEQNVFSAKAALAAPALISGNKTLSWQRVSGAFWYRIYRSDKPNFVPGPENYLTYVSAETTSFKDNGLDFASRDLSGDWYYRVTATTADDRESAASKAASVRW